MLGKYGGYLRHRYVWRLGWSPSAMIPYCIRAALKVIYFPDHLGYTCRQNRLRRLQRKPWGRKDKDTCGVLASGGTLSCTAVKHSQTSPGDVMRATQSICSSVLYKSVFWVLCSVNCPNPLFCLSKLKFVFWSLHINTLVGKFLKWFFCGSVVLFLKYFRLNHVRDHLPQNYNHYFLHI